MIRLKIAFALRLVDDFSGQSILKKKFRFVIGERVVHPIEKDEGVYVFLEPQETEARVLIEGTDYHSCTAVVKKELLDPEEPVAEVRLYGRAGGSFSYSRELLTGRLPETSGPYPAEVYAERSKPTGLVFKEYRNLQGAHWVFFQGFTKENLIGKTCILGKGKNRSVFYLMEKRGVNEYRVECKGDSPEKIKPGTPLVRIYSSVTDRHGAYSIPVDPGEEVNIREVMIL